MSSTGRHRGKEMTPEEERMEAQAKGHNTAGGPGVEGENEISDPNVERGAQHGYGKNQDKEPERKTPQNRAFGARG